jgi:TRAP-type C4-dicarboxylate transport system permease small subunit
MVGVALVIPMMVLIIADVILRTIFDRPITGTVEIACLMLLCMSLGMAWCAMEERHLKIEILMSFLPPRIQAIVDSITILAGLFIVIIMAWRNLISALWKLEIGQVASIILPIPLFPFHLVLVLGLVVMCMAMIALVIKKIGEAIKS